MIATGRPVQPYLDQLASEHNREAQLRVIYEAFSLIASSPKPILVIDLMSWVSGASLLQKIDAPELAKRNGIAKQAFCRAAFILAEKLGIKPPQAMRDEAARIMFSRSNHRPVKTKL